MVLSKATDALDVRLGLGEELGGLLLLALAGSLPEVAITVSAAAGGHLGLAAGNLIGGIAVQTMVLLICDAFAGDSPLSFLVGALTPVLEGLLVMIVVCGVLMGALLNESTAIAGVVSPASARDLRCVGHRALRDQPGAEGAAVARVDAGQPAGPEAPSRAAFPASRIRTRRTRPRGSLCSSVGRAR